QTLWTERLDYDGSADRAAAVRVHVPPSGPREIWVTGTGADGVTSELQALTARYQEQSGSVSDFWADAWALETETEPICMTLFEGDAYITGQAFRSSTPPTLPMMAWMYFDDSPDATRGWNRSYT